MWDFSNHELEDLYEIRNRLNKLKDYGVVNDNDDMMQELNNEIQEKEFKLQDPDTLTYKQEDYIIEYGMEKEREKNEHRLDR